MTSSASDSTVSGAPGFRASRRAFLRGSLAGVAGAIAAPSIFEALVARGELGLDVSRAYAQGNGGYGPLAPTRDMRDGALRIALPPGFQYVTFGLAGSVMSDTLRTPLGHDGMATFRARNGNVILVRNHEDRNAAGAGSAGGSPKYDSAAGGGTTTLEINPHTRQVVRDFISITGTAENCAGGPTPWGTYLTCEETVKGRASGGWQQPHGYVFEVPASATGPVPPDPLRMLGRFRHEVALADFGSGIVYQTEDNGNNTSGFYRFVPRRRGDLRSGGDLQMLAVTGQAGYDTSNRVANANQTPVGQRLPVEWVTIANPDPPEGPTGFDPSAVFNQGLALGGARFSRLEGLWAESIAGVRRGDDDDGRGRGDDEDDGGGNGRVYFASTNGGRAGVGQVWEYRPRGRRRGWLTLIFESQSPAQLDFPDNLVVTPRGGIVLNEDGNADQYLRGLTRRGQIFDFALNLQNDSEWAGSVFSFDGQTMFVNRQGPTSGANPPATPSPTDNVGMTFAIWGPWERGAL